MNRKALYATILVVILLVAIGAFYTIMGLMKESPSLRWIEIEYWGNMNETSWRTPWFEITGEEWRVWWNTNPAGGEQSCEIRVYYANNDTLVTTGSLSYNTREYATYFHYKGFFYMRLDVHNVDRWYMYVEEFKVP
jgi:hypothetical protein